MLREEVEEAVRNPREGKSPGVDNIPSVLLKNEGETTPTVLTVMYQKIWEMKEWTQSFLIPLPQKSHLKQCKNCRTISLISHPSKVMLRVILNRLKAKAEELLAEEQAGFRPGWSTAEQIFNCQVITEKHHRHPHDRLYEQFEKDG